MKKGNMNQKYSRTFLACLLSLCITVMMAPMAVFAESEAAQADLQDETTNFVETTDGAGDTEEVAKDIDETEAKEPENTEEEPVAENAEETEETEEAEDAAEFSGYVLMNIPYSVFYGAETVSAADVDSVTSATNKVGNYGKAGGAYHNGTSASVAEDGTVTAVGGANGSKVQGVIWPVKADSLDEVKALGGKEITDESSVVTATVGRGQSTSQTLYGYEALTEADAYSYYVLSKEPDHYAVLSGGKITAVQGGSTSKEGAAVTVSYGTNWGDVQLTITGVDDASAGLLNAVVLTTKDGNKVGLYHLGQVWSASDIAWKADVIEGLDGTTITNIRYYCSVKDSDLTDTEAPAYVNYVYDYPVNVEVAEVYTGEVTAEFTDANTITLSGLPEDAQNVKAKVYHTTGGRNAKLTYLTPLVVDPADDDIDPATVDVVDGKITIEAGSVTNSAGTTKTYGDPIGGTTYTIELSSDNYIIHKSSAVHPGYYVLMNIPYGEFYEAEGVEGVDAVTSSTVKTYNQTIAGGSYHAGYENTTDEDGKITGEILGVTYPVNVSSMAALEGKTAITDDSSATITVASGKSAVATKDVTGKDVLFASGDYAYYALSEEPSNYKTLTVNEDGSYSFSAVKNGAEDKEITSAQLSYDGHHTPLTLKVAAEEITDDSVVTAILISAGEETYALRHVENIWKKTELGWYWTDFDGDGLSGKTITNITYYTQDGGVYSYDVNVAVKKNPGDNASAEFESSKSIAVTGLPGDIENPVATVSSVVGRGQTPVVIAEGVAVSDGKIATTTAAVYDTSYTVKVVSDNYADISVTATISSSSAAKTKLDEAQAALEAVLADESATEQDKLDAYSAFAEAYANYSAALACELADAQVVDISNFAVTLGGKEGYSATYTGKAITPAVAVSGVDAGKYTVAYANNTNAGTATVTITASADGYKGSIKKTFTIAKAANGLKVKNTVKTVKRSKVKKAKRTVTPLTVSGNNGNVTYKKTSGSAKLTVNKTTGKVTVKKGTRKGTYKAVIAVTAAGDANHNAVTKKVTVKVKVK